MFEDLWFVETPSSMGGWMANGWAHVKSLKSNKSCPDQDNSIMDILDILLRPLQPFIGLFLRIGDWLCILPAITLVVDKCQRVNKAASLDWWTTKPTGPTVTMSLSSWRGPCIQSTLLTPSTCVPLLCIQGCIKAINTSVDIHNIQCIAHFDPLYQLSQHENEEATVPFTIMYAQLWCCTVVTSLLSNSK